MDTTELLIGYSSNNVLLLLFASKTAPLFHAGGTQPAGGATFPGRQFLVEPPSLF